MAGDNNQFNWLPERWRMINNLIHAEAARLRRSRRDEGASLPENHSGRLFTLNGPQEGDFVDHVIGYKVDAADPKTPLKMPPGQVLVPTKIWARFQLSKEQYSNENVAKVLASKAAYRLALAEDHVILSGDAAQGKLDALGISYEYLPTDTKLFTPGNTVKKSVLDSIIEGIKQLRSKNHHGEYCAIVATDLYREAFAPRKEAMDAPIYEIRPLLMKNGFTYSPALEEKTGVIFSLGGHTLDIAVPVDAQAELDEEEKGVAILRVVEQFRLRINDATAVVSLGEP